jgi:hypothetical protein
VLQKGLEILNQDSGKERNEGKDSDPTVDGFVSPDSSTFKLHLVISIAGSWQPTYDFHLKSIKLDDIEVVKSHVRDAMEEINTLKAEAAKPTHAFLSLTASSAVGNQQIVKRDGPKGLHTSSHFDISADYATIAIKQDGVYQIHCRLGQSNTGNQHVGILIDGVKSHNACRAFGGHFFGGHGLFGGHQHFADHRDPQRRCRSSPHSAVRGQQLQNRLSVVLLQAM